MKNSLLNRLCNISEPEWPRIIVAWLINLFFRIGFVLGWTVLISMFVSRLGITHLPILFIINALLVICGTLFYSELVRRLNRETMMVITTLTAGIILYIASFFAYHSNFIFLGLILISLAIFITQLKIIIDIFVEDLFTPLESQRTFPIIESSETIGGIIGGIIIMLLAPYIPSYKFLYLWVIFLGLIIPIVFLFRNFTQKLPCLKLRKHSFVKSSNLKKFKEGFNQVRKIPFLKSLLIIVLCQWIFVNLLEFQYTKAIHQSITQSTEITHSQTTSIITSPIDQTISPTNPTAQTINKIPNYERSLTFNLGSLFIVFSVASLLIQLLIASRIINALGTIGSLLLFPVVMLLNMIGLTFRFNFLTAVITRTSYEITNAIYYNAYHTSYYALEHKIREQAREFMEGLIKPLGAIIGMLLLLGLQFLVMQEKLTLSINILMIIITLIILFGLLQIREKYTLVSKKVLKYPGNHPAKYNAIEILSQKGHKNVSSILEKNLADPEENENLKTKILETLGTLQDPHSISEIIDCFSHPSEKIRLAAVEALSHYENLGKHFYKHAFSQYRVIKNLKKLFSKETSEEIRSTIIKALAQFNQTEVVSFILKTLKNNPHPQVKADCIYVCGLFHDPNAAHYIKPYLKSKILKIKANAMIALWQFKKYRPLILKELDQLLIKTNQKKLTTAIYILGEIKPKKLTHHLLKHLKSTNPTLKKHAALSLAKMGHEKSILPIVEMIFEPDQKNTESVLKVFKNLHPQIQPKIENLTHQRASHEINLLLNQHEDKSLEELDQQTLKKLKQIYQLVNEHEEVLKINQILKTLHPDSSSKPTTFDKH